MELLLGAAVALLLAALFIRRAAVVSRREREHLERLRQIVETDKGNDTERGT